MSKGIFFVPVEALHALTRANVDPLVVLSYLLLAELTGTSGEISKGGEATIMRRYGVGKKRAKEALTVLSCVAHDGTPIVSRESTFAFLSGSLCAPQKYKLDSWIISTFTKSRKIWLNKDICSKEVFRFLASGAERLKMLMFLYVSYDHKIDAVRPETAHFYAEEIILKTYEDFTFCFANGVNVLSFNSGVSKYQGNIDDEDRLRKEDAVIEFSATPDEIIMELFRYGFIELRFVAANDFPVVDGSLRDASLYLLDVKSQTKRHRRPLLLDRLEAVSEKTGYKCDRRLRRYAALTVDGMPHIVGLIRPLHVALNTITAQPKSVQSSAHLEQLLELTRCILQSELPPEVTLLPQEIPVEL